MLAHAYLALAALDRVSEAKTAMQERIALNPQSQTPDFAKRYKGVLSQRVQGKPTDGQGSGSALYFSAYRTRLTATISRGAGFPFPAGGAAVIRGISWSTPVVPNPKLIEKPLKCLL